jgi:hypothetical protein
MQIWVFLFAGNGVNLAKGGETTGAHPQAGTAPDRFVFAYIFLFFLPFYYSVFAKNHNVWMTAPTTTSLPVKFPLFICLFVCLCINKRVFFSIALGRECGYGIFVWFGLLYISRELPEGSVCFVSCTAGAGI